MPEHIHIGDNTIPLHWDSHEQCLSIRSADFIGETNGVLFFPTGVKTPPATASLMLEQFVSDYGTLKSIAFSAIGKQALEGNYWGKQLSQNPQMDLVWARFTSLDHSKPLAVILAYNDAEHDVYTLWFASFQGLELKSVERKAW